MIKEIAELINNNYNQIRNNQNNYYFIKIEIGKYHKKSNHKFKVITKYHKYQSLN